MTEPPGGQHPQEFPAEHADQKPQPQAASGWGLEPRWGGEPQWGAAPPNGPTPPNYYSGGWGSTSAPGTVPSGGGSPLGPPAQIVVKPGIVPLRPLRLGEILDGSFQAIRSNPSTMLGASAIVALVMAVIGLLPNLYYMRAVAELGQLAEGPAQEFTARDFAPLLAGVGGVMFVAVLRGLATVALSAILALPVGEAVVGRKLELSDLRQRLRGRLGGILAVAVILGLGPFLLLALLLSLTGIPIALDAANILPTWLSVPIVLLLVFAAVVATAYVFNLWSLTGPAYALEGVGAIAALRRSRQLVRGSWWRVAGIQVLAAIIAGVVGQLLAGPASIAGGIVNAAGQGTLIASLLGAVLLAIGEILVGAVVTPFSAAVTALVYFDRRMRSEGLDVELTRAGGATPV